MDQFDEPSKQKRTGVIVVILVVVGLALVGIGAMLVMSKGGKGGGTGPAINEEQEIDRWCQLRQEWAKKVNPMAGDILLKSVRAADKAERDKLELERNKTCQEYARKVRDLKITDENLGAIEVALVKEGKMRANVVVEIDNLLAKLNSPDTNQLREGKKKLDRYIRKRIADGKGTADREIAEAMKAFGDKACSGIYRGPMTDEGTSGNPYVSWEELDLQRTSAVNTFNDKIVKIEPVEQFTNRVYHELFRRHRGILKKCYTKAKAKNPSMSSKMGMRIRLKNSGKVATLGIEWMEHREESILDCLLDTAAKWRLPAPDPELTNVVVVTVDFSIL